MQGEYCSNTPSSHFKLQKPELELSADEVSDSFDLCLPRVGMDWNVSLSVGKTNLCINQKYNNTDLH